MESEQIEALPCAGHLHGRQSTFGWPSSARVGLQTLQAQVQCRGGLNGRLIQICKAIDAVCALKRRRSPANACFRRDTPVQLGGLDHQGGTKAPPPVSNGTTKQPKSIALRTTQCCRAHRPQPPARCRQAPTPHPFSCWGERLTRQPAVSSAAPHCSNMRPPKTAAFPVPGPR